ncbi:uncharacterized protein PRCAT00003878001 [Priceomyces carsonii]|uniref:uncharacterized protein n=1 Tax=Priceomyces carsonii TaxID=28549 RepID=UPI002ED8680D|nr:unnamed protein product [Priceomyces carsonii]
MSLPNNSKDLPESRSMADNSKGSFKLPPISFLSHQQQTNQLPLASNLGIINFMSAETKNQPKELEHIDKKVKLEGINEKKIRDANDNQYSSDPGLGFETTQSEKREDNGNSSDPGSAEQGNITTNTGEKVSNTISTNLDSQNRNNLDLRHHHHHHHHHAVGPHHHHHHHHHHYHGDEEKNNPQDTIEGTSDTNNSPAPSLNNDEGNGNHKDTRGLISVSPANNGSKDKNEISSVLKQKSIEKYRGLVKLNKGPIIDIIKEYFPERRNLGSLVYNPTTSWLTLQTDQLTGLKPEHHERFNEIKRNYLDILQDKRNAPPTKLIPVIPPLPTEYVNSIIEIKIPFRFVKFFKENMEMHEGYVKNRNLWGGASGVYTDDSDILTVLVHLGLFSDSIDLSEWNVEWTSSDFIRPLNSNGDFIGDLSVEVLLLPSLPEYHGFFANGVNSRSWLGVDKHDGQSIAVYNVKWENYGAFLQNPNIFKQYQLEMRNDEFISKQEAREQEGWKFDYKYFKKLKQKYENQENKSVLLEGVS